MFGLLLLGGVLFWFLRRRRRAEEPGDHITAYDPQAHQDTQASPMAQSEVGSGSGLLSTGLAGGSRRGKAPQQNTAVPVAERRPSVLSGPQMNSASAEASTSPPLEADRSDTLVLSSSSPAITQTDPSSPARRPKPQNSNSITARNGAPSSGSLPRSADVGNVGIREEHIESIADMLVERLANRFGGGRSDSHNEVDGDAPPPGYDA